MNITIKHCDMEEINRLHRLIEKLPVVRNHALEITNNAIKIKGAGYSVIIKVINEKEVVLSKHWNLGILGFLLSRQKERIMNELVKSVSDLLINRGVNIHSIFAKGY